MRRKAVLLAEGLKQGGECIDRQVPQATLPQRHDLPAKRLELTPCTAVARAIPLDLLCPKVVVRGREPTTLAVVTVPEASMNPQDGAVFGQNDIRTAREALDVNFETPTEGADRTANEELRLGTLVSDPGHPKVRLSWNRFSHRRRHCTKVPLRSMV
jgi:hypothetical protein